MFPLAQQRLKKKIPKLFLVTCSPSCRWALESAIMYLCGPEQGTPKPRGLQALDTTMLFIVIVVPTSTPNSIMRQLTSMFFKYQGWLVAPETNQVL